MMLYVTPAMLTNVRCRMFNVVRNIVRTMSTYDAEQSTYDAEHDVVRLTYDVVRITYDIDRRRTMSYLARIQMVYDKHIPYICMVYNSLSIMMFFNE